MAQIECFRLIDNVPEGCCACCLRYEYVVDGDEKGALKRLAQWADENGYSIATGPDDDEADAVIQSLTPVQKTGGRA